MSDQTPAQGTATDPAAEPSPQTELKPSPAPEPEQSTATATATESATAPDPEPEPEPARTTHAEPEAARAANHPEPQPSPLPTHPEPQQSPLSTPEQPPPHPLGVTLERTGNADVDALLERLADADDLPTEGHIEVYEDVHRGLRDTLTALDSRPGPPGPNRRHDDRS